MAERRAVRRYELFFPILVRIAQSDTVLEYVGVTRNISVKCVHFTLNTALAPRIPIEFTITLPAEVTGGTRVFVRGGGQVLWVSSGPDNTFGMTADIERYEICRDDSGAFTDAL